MLYWLPVSSKSCTASIPRRRIDFMVRKGNEGLVKNHPYLREVLIWEKKSGKKYKSLWDLLQRVRAKQYDKIINIQRFAATGLITALSGAKETIGFDKNPFSRFFTKRIKHVISDGTHTLHEIERNDELISDFTSGPPRKAPALSVGSR